MTSIPLSSKCEMRWQMRWRPFPCLPSAKWDVFDGPSLSKCQMGWQMRCRPLPSLVLYCGYLLPLLQHGPTVVAAVQLLLQRQHTLCVWLCCVTQTSLLLVYLRFSLRGSLILMTVMLLAADAASWHVSLVARTATHLFAEDEEPCCHFSHGLVGMLVMFSEGLVKWRIWDSAVPQKQKQEQEEKELLCGVRHWWDARENRSHFCGFSRMLALLMWSNRIRFDTSWTVQLHLVHRQCYSRRTSLLIRVCNLALRDFNPIASMQS